MIRISKLFVTICLAGAALTSKAQDAKSLTKEGIELSNAKSYNAAIDKYKAALALEPGSPSANYQMGFALNNIGKGSDALPFLQKAAEAGGSTILTSSAYELMGNIYDQTSQPQQAIANYQKGLMADSTSYSLNYNLGLAYFRNRQYAEAEHSAVAALKLNPSHAGSMRLYALVTFHQDNRAAALLGFCCFLWLEPNTAKSAEAYGNIRHILKGGALKAGQVTGAMHLNQNTVALNQAITQAVAAVAKRKYIMAADQFTEQLQAIFNTVGAIAEKQAGLDPFFNHLAAHYYKLSQTTYMPVFSRVISQSVDKAGAAWLQTHAQQVEALNVWVKTNQ